MNDLSRGACEPCNRDSPKLEDSEIERLLGEIPEWQRRDRNGVFQLERQFRFRTFADALTFTNKVGALAEAERHLPALLTEWGRVTVTWWTHAIGGLHKNDFIMAARTDSLYHA